MKQNNEEKYELTNPLIKSASPEITIIYRLVPGDNCYDLAVEASDIPGDQIYVKDIARSPKEATELRAMLAENLVFPYNVPEILDDFL